MHFYIFSRGRSGDAKVLGNFQCQGVLLIWIIIGQGSILLSEVRVGIVRMFFLFTVKSIRRIYGKITGNQLPVHFPLFSMIFFLLINVKMPTKVGILTFYEQENSIIDLSQPEKS